MRIRIATLCALLLSACATSPHVDRAALTQQVADTERAFAKTMADRDFNAFQTFLSDETVWFGGKGAMRGKQAVIEKWKAFYDGPKAPFSWTPDTAEVLDSGKLALTSGPVYDPDGKLVARFTSIWRQESPGTWRIVFDKGCDVCNCKSP